MYDKNVAITGCTIEKTTKYDRFREDKIRMELYRTILMLYGEGYHKFSCNLNTYIGLLAADTVIMLRKADKCPDIHLSTVITGTRYPADTDKVYCALYDDLIKQADSKETFPEKRVSAIRLPVAISSVITMTFPKKCSRYAHPALLIPISVKGYRRQTLQRFTTTFPAVQSVFRWTDAYS